MPSTIDYRNKLILAPMVRISTLPTRLLSLEYGADLVYSEEIIDFKMLLCERIENKLLGTVDFVLKDGTVVFRTCPQEAGKVVFQMGTANAARALKVARMIEDDVAAVDINMGCPKEFSIKGGMGAALLTQPEKIKDILTTLVTNLSIPVTCKIRILPTIEETLSLARMIESTGVQALAIHGRLKEERPQHSNHNNCIKAVADALTIPVIANGGSKEMSCYEEIEKFKEETGCTSVMIARAAQWNPSVFRPQGMLTIDQVIDQFLNYVIQYDSEVSNVKYCVQQVMHKELDTPRGKALQASGLFTELCELFGKLDQYRKAVQERKVRIEELQKEAGKTITTGFTTAELEDGSVVIEMPFVYNKKQFGTQVTPKSLLYEYTKVKRLPNPHYHSVQDVQNRTYACTVTIDNKKYRSTFSDSSKKYGEQAAAVVCLRYLGLDDGGKPEFESTRTSWKHLHQPRKVIGEVQNSRGVLTHGGENSEANNHVVVKRTGQEGSEWDSGVTDDVCSKRTRVDGQKTEGHTADRSDRLSEVTNDKNSS